jgi:hypothetical protein
MKLQKINCYICEKCRTVTVVVHIDEGVTPMMIGCTQKGCEGLASSFMYRIPPPILASGITGNFKPTHEWYKNGDEEQLELRERTDAKPLMVDMNN